MTSDPLYLKLLETSWRRKLTPAESAELAAWLKTHPEAQADWELEAGLNDLMERLPEADVPSNFTARVLAEAQRPSRGKQKQDGIRAFWARRFSWLPRIAMASLVLGSGILAYHQLPAGQDDPRTASDACGGRNCDAQSRDSYQPGRDSFDERGFRHSGGRHAALKPAAMKSVRSKFCGDGWG